MCKLSSDYFRKEEFKLFVVWLWPRAGYFSESDWEKHKQ